jgi:hypothetical protein
MSVTTLLLLAGVVALGAKVLGFAAGSRLAQYPSVRQLGPAFLAASTAAIGAPALLSASTAPGMVSGAAVGAATVGVVLAARGRPLLVTLPAAVATYALASLVVR